MAEQEDASPSRSWISLLLSLLLSFLVASSLVVAALIATAASSGAAAALALVAVAVLIKERYLTTGRSQAVNLVVVLALAALWSLSGAPPPTELARSGSRTCPQVMTGARHSFTGECHTFNNGCIGWPYKRDRSCGL